MPDKRKKKNSPDDITTPEDTGEGLWTIDEYSGPRTDGAEIVGGQRFEEMDHVRDATGAHSEPGGTLADGVPLIGEPIAGVEGIDVEQLGGEEAGGDAAPGWSPAGGTTGSYGPGMGSGMPGSGQQGHKPWAQETTRGGQPGWVGGSADVQGAPEQADADEMEDEREKAEKDFHIGVGSIADRDAPDSAIATGGRGHDLEPLGGGNPSAPDHTAAGTARGLPVDQGNAPATKTGVGGPAGMTGLSGIPYRHTPSVEERREDDQEALDAGFRTAPENAKTEHSGHNMETDSAGT